MSFVCVSAMRSSALRFVGSATRARFVPGADLRPALDGHELQHAGHARLHLQILELTHAQFVGGARLIDRGFLRGHLRLDPFGRHLEPLLGDGQPVLEFLGRRLRLLQLDRRNQPIFRERLVCLEVQRGVLVLRLDAGHVRLLAEEAAFQFRLAVLVVSLRRLERELRFFDALLQIGVAQYQDDRVGLHLGARTQHDGFHPP